jgi:hypothetical protein
MEMLYTSLATDNEVPGTKIAAVAKNIENSLFEEYEGTSQSYKAKIRTLYLNLKDKKNPSLRMKVVDGEITPTRLCNMSTAVSKKLQVVVPFLTLRVGNGIRRTEGGAGLPDQRESV